MSTLSTNGGQQPLPVRQGGRVHVCGHRQLQGRLSAVTRHFYTKLQLITHLPKTLKADVLSFNFPRMHVYDIDLQTEGCRHGLKLLKYSAAVSVLALHVIAFRSLKKTLIFQRLSLILLNTFPVQTSVFNKK